jgi:hypothetical protein
MCVRDGLAASRLHTARREHRASHPATTERIPICDACMSNRALSRLAAARLERALQIGIARKAP